MSVKKIWIFFLLPFYLLMTDCSGKKPVITIAAASSMTDVTTALIEQFKNQTAIKSSIQFSFASSGVVRTQIENGSPIDMFILAGDDDALYLENKGFLKIDTLCTICMNHLVCISQKENGIHQLEDLLNEKTGKIAVGNPGHVPAGKFAKNLLIENGIWNRLTPKLVFAENVRQVLSYVELGNADAGFVYRTDAMISGKAVIVFETSVINGKPIIYTAAITNKGAENPETGLIFEYIKSENAYPVLEKYGFIPNKKE